MKIYFVRHGQTAHNKNSLITGQLNVPLTREGIEEAEKILLEIPDDFSEIYSSDLLRCQQTAEILNRKLHASIQYDSRLRERDFGSLAGKKITDLDPITMEKDKNQQYDYRPFGGESAEEVKKRLFACIDGIRRNKKSGTSLIVTSGGIIRLLHYVLNGKVSGKINNSSVHEFEFP